jgi:hypothetical protein
MGNAKDLGGKTRRFTPPAMTASVQFHSLIIRFAKGNFSG